MLVLHHQLRNFLYEYNCLGCRYFHTFENEKNPLFPLVRVVACIVPDALQQVVVLNLVLVVMWVYCRSYTGNQQLFMMLAMLNN